MDRTVIAVQMVSWLALHQDFLNFYAEAMGWQPAEVYTIYTIHNTLQTWNQARKICQAHGSHLLTIRNEEEWNIWQYLMNPDTSAHTRPGSVYWTGIHAPDLDNPSVFHWDSCDLANFTEPLVDKHEPSYWQCVNVWFHRKVFNDAFLSMWIKGKPCNETLPFICEAPGNNLTCTTTCDEVFATVTEQSCTRYCDRNQSCTSQFNPMSNVCHLKLDRVKDKQYLTICHAPSLELVISTCTNVSDQSAILDVIDVNENVTNTICAQSKDSNSTTEDTTDPTCSCSCDILLNFLSEPKPETANLTVEEKINIIVKELTIDKKNTTIAQRKHVSVMDHRPSSVSIGSVSAATIVLIIGIVVVMDLPRLWHDIMRLFGESLVHVKKNKVHATDSATNA